MYDVLLCSHHPCRVRRFIFPMLGCDYWRFRNEYIHIYVRCDKIMLLREIACWFNTLLLYGATLEYVFEAYAAILRINGTHESHRIEKKTPAPTPINYAEWISVFFFENLFSLFCEFFFIHIWICNWKNVQIWRAPRNLFEMAVISGDEHTL